jgi:hypothetical protein
MGKTRLLIQAAAELRKAGWMAGFLERPDGLGEAALKQRWQALDQLIAHGEEAGLLIVMDYAEARQDEVTEITRALLAQAEQTRRPLRLVLLARSAGTWWDVLTDEQPEVQRLFHRSVGETDVIALAPFETGEQRRAFLAQCLNEFGATLRAQGIQPPQRDLPPDRLERIISGEGYERPLAVQMEALLHLMAATPDAPGIDKQLDSVLGLERAHWDKLLGALDREAKRDMDRGVAQVIAVHSVPGQPAAEHLLMADAFYDGRRAARADVEPLYSKLATVYGAADGALMQLEPDLIGEHQVASIGDAELIEGCLRWIEGLPEEDREQRQRDLITLLQRATRQEHGCHSARAESFLTAIVRRHGLKLAFHLFSVAMSSQGSLERILISQFPRLPPEPFEAAKMIKASISSFGVKIDLIAQSLSGMITLREGVRELRSKYDVASHIIDIAVDLIHAGDKSQAWPVSRYGLAIYLKNSNEDPSGALSNYSLALIRLSEAMQSVGEMEIATNLAEMAVDVSGRVALKV